MTSPHPRKILQALYIRYVRHGVTGSRKDPRQHGLSTIETRNTRYGVLAHRQLVATSKTFENQPYDWQKSCSVPYYVVRLLREQRQNVRALRTWNQPLRRRLPSQITVHVSLQHYRHADNLVRMLTNLQTG